MNIAISQPRYLPSIGFLQRLAYVDLYVVFDTVQRQSRAWENRNQLALPTPKWLTIPIKSSSREILKSTLINGSSWVDDHINIIKSNYHKYQYYDEQLLNIYYSNFYELFNKNNFSFVDATVQSTLSLFNYFNLDLDISFASNVTSSLDTYSSGLDKIINICDYYNSSFYVSGINGKSYGLTEAFTGSKCKILYHKYDVNSNHTYSLGFFDTLFCLGKDKFYQLLIQKPILEPF